MSRTVTGADVYQYQEQKPNFTAYAGDGVKRCSEEFILLLKLNCVVQLYI